MAFMGAEIIRLVTRRILQARATLGKGIMGSVWTALLLVVVTLVTLRSFVPVFTFFRQEVVPHLRDSTLTVFNTQPLLFLVLNSMIFVVLAPSGLFNDKSCSHTETGTSQLSDESPAAPPAPDSDDYCTRTVQEEPDPPPVMKPEAETATEVAEVVPVSVSSSKRERRNRSTDGSPPKTRVKRKRSTAQKCQSVKQQITMGIVESGELGGRNDLDMEERRNQPDSLKDDDFEQFIDSFIARAHYELVRQEKEYARSSRTI